MVLLGDSSAVYGSSGIQIRFRITGVPTALFEHGMKLSPVHLEDLRCRRAETTLLCLGDQPEKKGPLPAFFEPRLDVLLTHYARTS